MKTKFIKMKIVEVTVKLKFPANYTEDQIDDIMTNCDYTFNFPTQDGQDEVESIDSEITDYEIK